MSDKTSDKLLKCPFCGSPSIYKTWHFEGYHGMKTPVIFCDSCKVIVMAEDDSTSTKIAEIEKYLSEKVEEAWNTRKPVDDVVEALEGAARLEVTVHGGRCNGKTLTLGYAKGIESAIQIVKEIMND